MQSLGAADESCPFAFNFDAASFKPGDVVSYRVTGSLSDFPFMGTLIEVHDDHVILASDPDDRTSWMRGTRESRPIVDESEIR